MNILCIGDIVGAPGRDVIEEHLNDLKKEFQVDCTIVNGENSAGGFGITERVANQLFKAGCDVITLGDHVWDKREIAEYLVGKNEIIRPANFPEGAPGNGWTILKLPSGVKVGVINILGRVFMRYNVDCPFRALQRIVKDIRQETNIIVVDMHAETTSEKIAMGWFINGEVSAVVGTHTHVATADETILSKGTGYITDLGMTGPHDSVIGQNKDRIIERFLSSMPHKFEVALDDIRLNGVVIDIDEKTGKARKIQRVQKKVS